MANSVFRKVISEFINVPVLFALLRLLGLFAFNVSCLYLSRHVGFWKEIVTYLLSLHNLQLEMRNASNC